MPLKLCLLVSPVTLVFWHLVVHSQGSFWCFRSFWNIQHLEFRHHSFWCSLQASLLVFLCVVVGQKPLLVLYPLLANALRSSRVSWTLSVLQLNLFFWWSDCVRRFQTLSSYLCLQTSFLLWTPDTSINYSPISIRKTNYSLHVTWSWQEFWSSPCNRMVPE